LIAVFSIITGGCEAVLQFRGQLLQDQGKQKGEGNDCLAGSTTKIYLVLTSFNFRFFINSNFSYLIQNLLCFNQCATQFVL
jgi:hypothetical protein